MSDSQNHQATKSNGAKQLTTGRLLLIAGYLLCYAVSIHFHGK